MRKYWNHEVVAFFGHEAQLAEEVAAARLKHTELTEQLKDMNDRLEAAEELLNLIGKTTEVINGIAIRVEMLDYAVDVAEIRTVSDPTNRWARVYKQVNSVEVQYGVQLTNHRTLFNKGYTKEQAIEIAKTWVATGEIK